MKNINIFCFGFGQVAKNFIKKLNSENFDINLVVTSRKKTQRNKINQVNYTSFFFDGESFDEKFKTSKEKFSEWKV